eukprot:TRINITY_DN7636_c0_g1_i1.p1 TRINITY_DN7636_c0_g1~~TRINITY_DN7636_c0_g1_i1.p1  ORF type:complete len:498 (+),score=92.61 TRINITY_DN7636_c0_g1_i1:101-1594(+)
MLKEILPRKRKNSVLKKSKTHPESPRNDLTPSPKLELELKEMWQRNFFDLPVVKDLPRLARRIVVLGTLKKVPSIMASNPLCQNGTELPLQKDVKSMVWEVFLNTEKIKSHRACMWPKSYVMCNLILVKSSFSGRVIVRLFNVEENTKVERTVCQIEIMRIICVEDSTRYFVCEGVHVDKRPELTNLGFAFFSREESDRFREIAELFSGKKLNNLDIQNPVAIKLLQKEKMSRSNRQRGIVYINEPYISDLNNFTNDVLEKIGSVKENHEEFDFLRDSLSTRLRAFAFKNATDSMKLPSSKDVEESHFPQREKVNEAELIAIERVINAVAAELETEEQQLKIKSSLTELLSKNYSGDLNPLVQKLFTDTIGENSKTAKVFKAIHQNIISCCQYQIKSTVTNNGLMTGDVRGPEGWQICVLFAHDVVNITHRRREKSLGHTNFQFWFEWVLHMTFDKELQSLNAAVLKIVDLHFEGNPSPEVKEDIEKRFCYGRLHVA